MQIAERPDLEHFDDEEFKFTTIQFFDTIHLVMINEKNAKWFCSEEISLIENY